MSCVSCILFDNGPKKLFKLSINRFSAVLHLEIIQFLLERLTVLIMWLSLISYLRLNLGIEFKRLQELLMDKFCFTNTIIVYLKVGYMYNFHKYSPEFKDICLK